MSGVRSMTKILVETGGGVLKMASSFAIFGARFYRYISSDVVLNNPNIIESKANPKWFAYSLSIRKTSFSSKQSIKRLLGSLVDFKIRSR